MIGLEWLESVGPLGTAGGQGSGCPHARPIGPWAYALSPVKAMLCLLARADDHIFAYSAIRSRDRHEGRFRSPVQTRRRALPVRARHRRGRTGGEAPART